MFLRKIALLFALITATSSFAQKGKISGVVSDEATGETIPMANVLIGEGVGTVADIDGKFVIEADYGTYTVKVSSVGFLPQEKQVELKSKNAIVNFKLSTEELDPHVVVADFAKDGETPVAKTTVLPAKIEEELASQDLPMVLNTTPGVYATQQGGGDGDARITIRGFSQRNIAVMIDGIPVNDMENGWVYWSNWFGLDAVTRAIQVQRGLGASKLAIPSVGGTMNILSKGIEAKKGGTVKQEIGNNGFLRTSIGLTSGRLKNGWGVTMAGSYKRGNGWVDKTYTKGWFYFAKIEKQFDKHLFSVSAMGAPQEHAQRSFKTSIMDYDADFAHGLGVDTTGAANRGVRYNQHWGVLDRYTLSDAGDTLFNGEETLNERINYYHKPQFSFKHFWNVNEKLYINNLAYLSVGRGGGTGLDPSARDVDFNDEGQLDFQKIYDNNKFGFFAIDPLYSTTQSKSGQILKSSINNHFWYGLLSTFNYLKSENMTISGGIDLRNYKGEHYNEVYDLLGGDYMIDLANANQTEAMKRVGDVINYHNDGLVKWGGVFGQMEFKKDRWSTFINLSGAYSGYKRVDYFKPKELAVGDTVLQLPNNSSVTYNGQTYTDQSAGVDFAQTEWKWIPGYTFKSGANYVLNENSNVFMNLGYLSRAPRFQNVFTFSNELFLEIKNELIKAIEFGYQIYYPKVAVNVNGYYTRWENKPSGGVSVEIDGENYSANINGMDALHMGMEVDVAYKPSGKLSFDGVVSIGNWTWESAETVRVYDEDNNPVLDPGTGEVFEKTFDATGVHVGDAAQTQLALAARYEFVKGAYLKARITRFDRHFADFDPLTLTGDNSGRESWQMPGYSLIDVHAGYYFKLGKLGFNFRASILNVLDEIYLSDARNNDTFSTSTSDFDAKSAGVFFGQGRRFNTSLKITF
jgi:iron complex outermembrane receptor protein